MEVQELGEFHGVDGEGVMLCKAAAPGVQGLAVCSRLRVDHATVVCRPKTPFIGMVNVRVMFTVVADDGEERDVVLRADPATTVGEIAGLVAAELHGDRGAKDFPSYLYVGETRLDPALALRASPVRDGCRVSLDRPNGGRARMPAGSPEAGVAQLPVLSSEGCSLIVHRPARGASPPPPEPEDFPAPDYPRRTISDDAVLQTLSAAAASLLLAIGLAIAFAFGFESELPVYGRVLLLLGFVGLAAVLTFNRLRLLSGDLARLREYHDELERTRQRALDAEQAWWDSAFPGPSALAAIAADPGHRLWERRRADPDFLEVSVGSADQESVLLLFLPGQQDDEPVRVPATVRLADCGVLGVVGPAEVSRELCRWLIMQIAVLHSPADVRVCVLTGPAAQDDWAWVRWLPHCRPLRGHDPPVWVGNDRGTAAARISELLAHIESRWYEDGQDVVVVFDDWRLLHDLPDAAQVLQAAGVHAICLGTSERRLPAERGTTITTDPQSHGLKIKQSDGSGTDAARQDPAGSAWCEHAARDLAPLRDAGALGRHGLPETARLIDVLDLNPPLPEVIAGRWTSARSMVPAVIGESGSGLFSIDLRRDGHGLIAGAAGSGKSELLQTIVASLAASNAPDAITFLLIGCDSSVFRNCADLPHTVGVITGERLVATLPAELGRRESMLAEAHASSIDDYASTRVRQPATQPLPRLVVAVDDFAVMARHMPGLGPVMVDIAHRGRNLGVHLLLATDRPAGVPAEVRAGAGLRIALRVAGQQESLDIINVPDASFIPEALPGRACALTSDHGAVPIQTCRVGGVPAPEETSPRLTPIGWADLGRPEQRPSAEVHQGDLATDLKVLVTAIQRASDSLG